MDPAHNNCAPGRGEERIPARPELPVTWRTVSAETPVFVDESGRRAHAVRGAAVAVAVLCALWLGGLVVGVTGFASFPAARPLIAGLPAGSRTPGASTEARLPGARELASLSRGVHPRAIGAVDDVARSICPAGRAAAGLRALGDRRADDRSHGSADRPACLTELVTGPHRPHSRLV